MTETTRPLEVARADAVVEARSLERESRGHHVSEVDRLMWRIEEVWLGMRGRLRGLVDDAKARRG